MNPNFRRIHPLTAIAAVSLTVFSLLGIGAITGVITPAHSERTDTIQTATPATPAEQQQAAEAFKSAPTAQPADKPTDSTQPAHRATKGKTTTAIARNDAPTSTASSDAKVCTHCGKVQSITLVKQDGDASGLGAVAGGVAGGLVGNQIGKGKGNVLMTILGVGGGAYAGNTIEKKVKGTNSYVVKVHMNDGSTRTVTMMEQPAFAVGDEVKLINGGLTVVS